MTQKRRDGLRSLEAAETDREQVTSVDRETVDDALDVTALSESGVCEVEEGGHDVDGEESVTGLQKVKKGTCGIYH